MDAERVRRICEVFLAALEVDPSGRQARLEELCAGDPELRAEVERLLAQDAEADRDHFLAPPTAPGPREAGRRHAPLGLRGLDVHILCPHCRNPIELVGLPPEEVVCPACGSTFRLERESTAPWSARGGQKRLGRFELIETVGVGAFGTVYKARDPQLDRTVAIKVPRAGNLATDEERDRFLREARSVAQLRHAAIVPVHEVGEHDGVAYLVSDFVRGVTLAERLTAGRPAPREAARIVAEVGDALQYAHERGVIHRDVKPSNIMLDDAGGLHVMDFGLAKRDAGEITMTLEGRTLGTPAYMSPEQARGEAHAADGRSDVYSLGVILYELLTGELPFRGSQRMLLHQVLHDEPRPPRRVNDRIARDLETICLRAMAKEPSRRYATAGELAADLRRWQGGEPIRARPVGRLERAWRWSRRRPLLASLAASVALLLAVVAVGTPVAVLSLHRAERRAVEKLWLSYLFGARANRLGGQAGQRSDSLKLLAEAAAIRPDPALRDEAIACLALTDLRVVRQWEGYPYPETRADFDPLLERYARSDKDGNVTVRRLADEVGTLRLPAPESGGAADLTFGPDGRFLAATHFPPDGRRFRHRVWSLPRGELVLDVPTDRPGAQLAFTSDGLRLAAGRPGHLLSIYELSTFREVRRLERVPNLVRVAFHPLGRFLAITCAGGSTVEVRDVDTGAVVATLPHPRGWGYGLAWSGDGATLAAGSDDHEVHLWDAATYRLRAVLKGHNAPIIFVAFHPSDRLLASGSLDGTTRLWDAATGQSLVTAPGVASRFRPDGTRLSFSNPPMIGIWEVLSGDAYRLLHPRWTASPMTEAGPQGNVGVSFSPGGLLLACAGLDGVRVWDLESAREVAHLPLGFCGAALFHPRDGSLITYGATGLRLWPIRPGPGEATDTLRLGPPRVLDPSCHSDSYHASLSRDGNLLVVGDRPNQQAVVLDLGRPAETSRFGEQPGINSVALSPDGRWVAAGSKLGPEVQVWDRPTGRPLARLPDSQAGGTNACVAFSPDGRWLVTGTQSEYRFWHTGSWRLGRSIPRDRWDEMPGLVAFARDGRSMAVTPSQRRVRLIEVATGRALADLSAPDPRVIRSLCFSPDDSRLVVATDDWAVQVWDLRRIRRHLATMRLDWVPVADAQWAAGKDGDDSPEPERIRVLPSEAINTALPTDPFAP